MKTWIYLNSPLNKGKAKTSKVLPNKEVQKISTSKLSGSNSKSPQMSELNSDLDFAKKNKEKLSQTLKSKRRATINLVNKGDKSKKNVETSNSPDVKSDLMNTKYLNTLESPRLPDQNVPILVNEKVRKAKIKILQRGIVTDRSKHVTQSNTPKKSSKKVRNKEREEIEETKENPRYNPSYNKPPLRLNDLL